MEITIIKDEKNDLEVQLDNQTVAELIRVYLNNDCMPHRIKFIKEKRIESKICTMCGGDIENKRWKTCIKCRKKCVDYQREYNLQKM